MADAQQTLINALTNRMLQQRGSAYPNFMGPPTTLPGQPPSPPGQFGGMPQPPAPGLVMAPNPPPGYEEWQSQPNIGMLIAGEPSQQPTPQINDLQQLFGNSIMRNAPTSNPMGGKFLRDITLGGHLAGGNEI